MENYLELIANDHESNANAILKEINVTEFKGNANDVYSNANLKISPYIQIHIKIIPRKFTRKFCILLKK